MAYWLSAVLEQVPLDADRNLRVVGDSLLGWGFHVGPSTVVKEQEVVQVGAGKGLVTIATI